MDNEMGVACSTMVGELEGKRRPERPGLRCVNIKIEFEKRMGVDWCGSE